ncbi:MAG: hypothetical protein JNM93_12065 [Bacteriovoracaceae bacterium]|nr:hypothetical protein [Bacteriovoracaceae bacterium]
MLHKNNDEITLIVYESPEPPRFLKINKKVLKTVLFFAAMLILIMAITTIFLGSYIKQLQNRIDGKLPESEVVEKLKNENLALTTKFNQLQAIHNELTQQLEQNPTTAKAEVVPEPKVPTEQIQRENTLPGPNEVLSLFKAIPGFKNLTTEKMAEIQRLNFRVKKDEIVFRFNLANIGTVKKLKGFIFVIQYSSKSLKFYPPIDLAAKNFKVDFTEGESFTVSRFRPTIINFDLPEEEKEVYYKVLLFSKEGHLILEEYHGPFSLI